MHYVYILRCADGSYYVGSAHDVDARMKAHNDGNGAAYTFKHREAGSNRLFRGIWLGSSGSGTVTTAEAMEPCKETRADRWRSQPFKGSEQVLESFSAKVEG